MSKSELSEICCSLCGLPYDKENKPRTMPCSHSLCQKCLSLNAKRLKCLRCNKHFNAKAIKRCPINFLILQIAEKMPQDPSFAHLKASFSSTHYYECKECSVKLSRYSLHQAAYPHHSLSVRKSFNEDETYQFLKQSCDKLRASYSKKSEDFNNSHFTQLNSLSKTVMTQGSFDLKQFDVYSQLLMSGIINPADKARLSDFNALKSNKTFQSIMESSMSYEDLIKRINECQEAIGFSSGQVLALWFYYLELIATKLNCENIQSKLKQMTEMINKDDAYLQDFYTTVLEKTRNSIHHFKTTKSSIDSYFLINNTLYAYSVSKSSVTAHKLPEQLLNGTYAHCLSFDRRLYLTSNDAQSYCYSLTSQSLIKLPKFKAQKSNYSIITCLGKLFAFGNDSTEVLDLGGEEKAREWKALASIVFKAPPLLILIDKVEIYAMNSISAYSKYEVLKDKWSSFRIKDSSLQCFGLNSIANYGIIPHLNGFNIYGGYNAQLNCPNDLILAVSWEEKKLKLLGKHQFASTKEAKISLMVLDEEVYVMTYENEAFDVLKMRNFYGKAINFEPLLHIRLMNCNLIN